MDTRKKIQLVATKLFSVHGYENCSVDRIAQEAGVSKGAVYYCFKSKVDILCSIVEDGLSNFEQEVMQTIHLTHDSSTAFERAVNKYVDLFFCNRDLCTIVMRDLLCTRSIIAETKITALMNNLFCFTALVIREGQLEGIVNATDAKLLAKTVCAVLYGYILFPGSGDKNEAVMTIKNMLKK